MASRLLLVRTPAWSSPWRNHAIVGFPPFSSSNVPRSTKPDNEHISERGHPTTQATRDEASAPEKEQGALSRRLEQATEDALTSGGRSGWRAIEDAGFSEELKAKLYEKVATATISSAEDLVGGRVGPGAGAGTRAHAEAAPWTGEESHEDAALRMLDDSKRKLPPTLRGRPAIPPPTLGRASTRIGGVKRAAGARELAETYRVEGKGLTEEEREDFLKELRERFQPGARALPNTISGLTSLANQRIEEAMARGQFKDIPRGPGIERDARADNPFIDTTEYLMNKMIKRQELVPPWIDKQQELAKAVAAFRARIRSDWKRHAARVISSRGGSLEEKIRAAEAYARAETARNGKATATATTTTTVQTSDALPSSTDAGPVFRDPAWEGTERSYLELSVEKLNSLARSYNLMAPELAKKPYFSLTRELESCYADVAPLVAEEIRNRAVSQPAPSFFGGFGERGGVDNGGAGSATIYEKRGDGYGFKEMWRDIWSKRKS